jgi:Holliday junction resolvase RusA-like endonuclease
VKPLTVTPVEFDRLKAAGMIDLSRVVVGVPKLDKPSAPLIDSAELPIPPSVNNLFAGNGRARWRSKEYEDWRRDVNPILRQLKPPKLPTMIYVRVIGKVNLRRDGDNLLKPIGDAIVDAGVIPDDCMKNVWDWWVSYRPGIGGAGRVIVSFVKIETGKSLFGE